MAKRRHTLFFAVRAFQNGQRSLRVIKKGFLEFKFVKFFFAPAYSLINVQFDILLILRRVSVSKTQKHLNFEKQ